MSEIRHIEHGDPEEANDEMKALEVARTLEQHYPNHPWTISFQGGSLIVRHLAINNMVNRHIGRDGFGFLMPPDKFRACSSRVLVDTAIQAGGQMLEAFGLPRGAWKGEEPIVPSSWRFKQSNNFQ